MISLLLFIALFTVWVYLILEPLAWLVREALLKLGDHVLGKRKHTCKHGECNGVGVHCGYSDCDGH